MKKLLLLVMLLTPVSTLASDNLDAPKMAPAQAIELAKKAVKEKEIDVSQFAIRSVVYKGFDGKIEKPYWEVEYNLLKKYAKGGMIWVQVYPDGQTQITYGE